MYSEVVNLAKVTSDVCTSLLHLSKVMKTMEVTLSAIHPQEQTDTLPPLPTEWSCIVDSLKFLSTANSTLAYELQNQLETPLLKFVETIKVDAEMNEKKAKIELHSLEVSLKKTEQEFKQFLKSKDKKNLEVYQNTLNELNAIACEMKSVQARPTELANAQAKELKPKILGFCQEFTKRVQGLHDDLNSKLKSIEITNSNENISEALSTKMKNLQMDTDNRVELKK